MAEDFNPFDPGQGPERVAVARAHARREPGRGDRERHAVRDPARRVPRRAARPALVLERDRDEGARRGGPVRGSPARRARSAAPHAGAARRW